VAEEHGARVNTAVHVATAPAGSELPVTPAIAELRRADRLAIVGGLLPAIAHELGTPLGVVLARARLIEARALSPADEVRSGGIIAAQVDRMSQVIRRLIDFSDTRRAIDSSRAPAAASVRLRALAGNVADILRPLAHRRQAQLRLEAGPEIAVRADHWLLEQALVSLAMKLIQGIQGPAEVRLRVARGRVAPPAGVVRPGEYAQLAVQTTRRALIPEPSCSILEGLAVPQGIVREQGGWIAMDPPIGRPRGFAVYLPVRAS
jgi:two-component system, NtrC family, sensor kinase